MLFVVCSVSLLCLALALHPFTFYPITLRLLARFRPRPLRQGRLPDHMAICVCAYNEQSVMQAKLENLLMLRATMPSLEILVYVDAATDGTAEIVRGFADRVKVIVSAERHGKTHGMNRLISMTDAEIVVFTDANVTFAPDALLNLATPFADPAVGCVCGNLRYVDPDASSSTAAAGSLYWRLEEHIKELESVTGSVMGADGSIFAIRRSLHQPPPPYLIDDMYVSLAILCGGARVVRAESAVAYENSVSQPREEFRRKIRIACQAFNVNRVLWRELVSLPWLDRYKYVSHKLLRWFSIYSLGVACLGGLCAVAMVAGSAAFAAATIFLCSLLLAVNRVHRGPLGKAREILSAFLATGLGVWSSARGKTFQTWTPPASSRDAGTMNLGKPVQA